ncbi:MAG: PAS domain-containing protein [Gammaproteobacteria bacterium]|nr:PAS domain-containing protein [Gammaproteobacteria bacterium]MDH3430062.1 PAS domain-containing protein [Gammaproteobacteria bacterium]
MEFDAGDIAFSKLTFESAVLDSLAANIAVIDSRGEILAVNARWQDFAIANDMSDQTAGIGANYLEVCRSARTDPNARAALRGILEVINGKRSCFYHEYPCHSPSEKRWFAMRATPLVDYPNCVVVSHEDITHRVAAEPPLLPPQDTG